MKALFSLALLLVACLLAVSKADTPDRGMALSIAISNTTWQSTAWPTGTAPTYPTAWIDGGSQSLSSGFGGAVSDFANSRTYFATSYAFGYTTSLTSGVPQTFVTVNPGNSPPPSNFVRFNNPSSTGLGYAYSVSSLNFWATNMNTFVASTYKQGGGVGIANGIVTAYDLTVSPNYGYLFVTGSSTTSSGLTTTIAWWQSATNPSGGGSKVDLNTNVPCYIALYDATSKYFYWGCTGGFMWLPEYKYPWASQNSNHPSASSFTFKYAGAGNFTTGVIDSNSHMMYLGSSIGLGIQVNLTTNTAVSLFFTFGSNELSALNSVFLDNSGVLPALFWGTGDGRVVRVNPNNFATVFGAISTGVNDNLNTVYTSADSSQVYFGAGYTPGVTTVNDDYYTYQLQKTNCSIYTCNQCLGSTLVDQQYCGMCIDTGLCTTQGDCTSAGNTWSQSGYCPSAITATVSGSTSGGTNSILNGTYFINAPTSSYVCSYSNGSLTLNGTVASVSNNSITCTSPAWPTYTGMPATTLTNITVYYKSRVWSQGWQMNFYYCPAIATSGCPSCGGSTYPECSWCFETNGCTSHAQCGSYTWLQPAGTCPSVGSISTASISVRNSTYSVSIPVTNFPPTNGWNYQCSFPGFASGVTATLTGNTLMCGLPPTSSTGATNSQLNDPNYSSSSPGSVQTGVTVSTSLGVTYGSTNLGIEVYNCTTMSICAICTSHAQCGWCRDAAGSCMFQADLSTSCVTPGAQCMTINTINGSTSLNIPLSKASNAPCTITGSNFQTGQAVDCWWTNPAASTQMTAASTLGTTTATSTCSTPSPLPAGSWSVAVGTATSPTTNSLPVTVYDCSQRTSCGTCYTGNDVCNWCLDLSNTGCIESTASCTKRVDGSSNTCPFLNYASPSSFPVTGWSNLTLFGPHGLGSSTTGAECYFQLGSSHNSTGVTYIDVNSVLCDEVPPVSSVGTAQVSIRTTSNNVDYTNFVNISYVSCDQFTDCESCVNGTSFCTWCGASCQSTCQASWTHEACPYVSYITPNFSSTTGGSTVNIYGGNFLTDAVSTTTPAAGSGGTGTPPPSGLKKRAKRGTTPYSCYWDPVTSTDVQVDSSGELSCDTPPRSVANTIWPLTIYFNGLPYLTTPGVYFFSCIPTGTDYCTSDCVSIQHCGWCVDSNTCGPQVDCNRGYGVWQSQTCPTVVFQYSTYPVQGEVPLLANISEPLPMGADNNTVACLFDTTSVAAEVIYIGNDTQSNQVSCTVPSVLTPTQVPFTVTYGGHDYFQPKSFTYSDCTVNTDCTSCISNSICGWCTTGGGKCLYETQCDNPTANWLKNSCPINKLALGLGLGIGLAVLAALIGVAIFFFIRARRRRGLVIELKEPDYDAIAWGNDVILAWKVPEHNYKILDLALARRDFLLQLAIAFNCPSTEQDALAKALVYVASAHGLAAEMIQTCIRYEVQTCLHENTLFRNNSVASKMYKFFSRIVGIKYLFNCIARVILELEVLGRQAKPSKSTSGTGEDDVSLLSMSMELDQNKATGDLDTDANILQLQLICQKLLNVIIKTSVKNIPAPFRSIFIEIDNSVMGRFAGSNDAVYKGIGGLFFLRFVCPAITAPHVYGLLEAPPNTNTQRQLVLISKVIQAIANMQPPGKKEEYMTALNDFIVKSIPKITKFYDNLRLAMNLPRTGESDEQVVGVPDAVRLNGIAATWNFLCNEKKKIRAWAQDGTDGAGAKCPLTPEQQEELQAIIAECEQAYPDPPKKLKAGEGAEEGAGGGEKKKKKKKKESA